jgi:homoaconitate hydratase family protein/3-isopropylmalate dehydratase small subunit
MAGKTFVEKVLKAPVGAIVFEKPDIVLTHDNTASIASTFKKMGGEKVLDANQLLVVLDHNAPPTNAKLATQYQDIRNTVNEQGISKFHDAGDGICHQLMANYAIPGMIIVGSDSHTCTAGAFNALAAGIDRTEAAGLWKRGETWFRVPESIKITLTGKLREGVHAKDLSLYIIGKISSAGANYMSIEYHGEGVATLSISDRMTIANLASEMGAKNAVFPADKVLHEYLGSAIEGVWADDDAKYAFEMLIDLNEIIPLIAAPHHVDNVKSLKDLEGTDINQGLIGTCTNGRIEDLRIAAEVLKGKKVKPGFQLLVVPASKEIYLQAIKEGILTTLLEAGANVLSSSCGPCLGTGQGIPADGYKVVSTANRNFLGRMGNKNSEVYLASPEVVAYTAISGKLGHPNLEHLTGIFEIAEKSEESTILIDANDIRKQKGVWNYSDVDNLNTDQMFAGNLTYNILSSDAEAIMPHLFAGFDENFTKFVAEGDIIVAGDNFGCGSSREHPAVGLAHAGVKAVIAKSVNRIFYRSSVNQGLPIIILPEFVESYKAGDSIELDMAAGILNLNGNLFPFAPLPEELVKIFECKGLVNYLKSI